MSSASPATISAWGDHPDAKPVFDLDSMHLIQAVRRMEQGKDTAGNELNGAIKFCVGAIVLRRPTPSSLSYSSSI